MFCSCRISTDKCLASPSAIAELLVLSWLVTAICINFAVGISSRFPRHIHNVPEMQLIAYIHRLATAAAQKKGIGNRLLM